jgi:hypothetical protein
MRIVLAHNCWCRRQLIDLFSLADLVCRAHTDAIRSFSGVTLFVGDLRCSSSASHATLDCSGTLTNFHRAILR